MTSTATRLSGAQASPVKTSARRIPAEEGGKEHLYLVFRRAK